MIRQLLFIPLISSLVLGAEQLPYPNLLPTTKAIREIILAKQKEEAAKLQAYTQNIPLAEGSKIDMIPIPAGKFKIGSDPASPKHMPDEAPQKEIAIQPFWMAKLETTWDIYRPYMENAKARNKDGTLNRDADMSTSEAPDVKEGETLIDSVTQPTPPYIPMHFSMGDGYSKDYPAVGITYHAANKFCEWLSAQTGTSIACRPKPNGNMPAVQERRPLTPLATMRASSAITHGSPIIQITSIKRSARKTQPMGSLRHARQRSRAHPRSIPT